MRKKLYLAASLGLSVMLMVAGIADYNSSYAKAKFNVKLSKTKVTLAKGKSYKLKVTTIKKAKITVTVKKGKDKVKKVCHVTVTKSKAQNAVTPTATDEPTDTHIKKEGDASQLLPNKSEGYTTFAPEIKKTTENNPLLTNSYAADPAVMEYDGRIYVYMTNDSQHYEKGNRSDTNSYGHIQSLHIISTDDMVNWTDHGTFQIAAANADDSFGVAKWAGCCWVPCTVHKKIDGKDKFFIYFTNGGYQIGVVEADSPAGPFTDPVGKALLGPYSANETTTGALDPSVFTDDDGTSYLCYGNGVLESNGKNGARIRKLADDMVSFAGPEIHHLLSLLHISR